MPEGDDLRVLPDQVGEGVHRGEVVRWCHGQRAVNSLVTDHSLDRHGAGRRARPAGMATREDGAIPAQAGAPMLSREILPRVRDAFDELVGPEGRDEVLRPAIPRHDRLHEVTILFADLRDFTGWVESTPPGEVAEDLSAYITEMERAIRRHRGLLLQFIGDEIEAVFGPPTRCALHADMAVAAALDMRRRLEALNERRERDEKGPLRHGIGIHTGTVLASAIGRANRRFYVLVGDAVNVASRIQELTRTVESDILVSASTRACMRRRHDFVEIGATTLRGRAAAVTVYRLR
jgi:class 3 adenylate cyclase